MNAFLLRLVFISFFLLVFIGCANIVPPTGGKKDVEPPKLLLVEPKDSLLNTRVTEIEMRFDEFINLNDASKEIQISPLMPFPLTTVLAGKKVTVKIPDSLLKENTTYRISFGSAIQDLNENNELKNLNYIFSTGDYFDSLKLFGEVKFAANGLPASEVFVLLYDAEESDSAVVKKKPMYVTKVQAGGRFILPGLPAKPFRIYALKDDNENLVYDGEDEEIAFIDSVLYPVDSLQEPLALRLFKEIAPLDTLEEDDSSKATPELPQRRTRRRDKSDDEFLRYSIAVDTTDTAKRTHDVNKPLRVTFNNPIDTFDTSRISLSYLVDSNEVPADIAIERDTTEEVLFFKADWKLNTVYVLRVLKDFATDTAGLKSSPAKYIFRTLSEDDYGVININVPGKYYGEQYLLQVMTQKDTVYNKPLTDTSVRITRLLPEKYGIFIIVDENKNGKWDTGDLFGKVQPEYVLPYSELIELRPGWENVIDFKMPVSEPDTTNNTGSRSRDPKGRRPSPGTGDRPGAK